MKKVDRIEDVPSGWIFLDRGDNYCLKVHVDDEDLTSTVVLADSPNRKAARSQLLTTDEVDLDGPYYLVLNFAAMVTGFEAELDGMEDEDESD